MTAAMSEQCRAGYERMREERRARRAGQLEDLAWLLSWRTPAEVAVERTGFTSVVAAERAAHRAGLKPLAAQLRALRGCAL
ncbi:hypothetical protein BRM3_09045 [Brachybacterium huguangmaarense]|uniref:Uncharacterized protein n=1 Tax=Brachybacterium huguangmaarense TaxID=1652028 RepID=A0ABY6FYV2_9MICO|nr:hypothetical protein [Brachybacterium huguangmaarense]UYG15791.1 hypothetical protein BRM3_09045 [Brachybacterium huguangmaarense]